VKINFRSNLFSTFFLFINISHSYATLNSVVLSNSFVINPLNPNRLYIQSCLSLESKTEKNYNQIYPDISFGYKVSKNLAFVGSIFGYNSSNLPNQTIGAGFQYFYGSDDTLTWVISLKRVNSRSIKKYNTNNLVFDISKWIQYKSIFLRFGSGASFLRRLNFSSDIGKQTGQDNFIFISSVLPLKILRFGIEAKMNPNIFLYSFFIQKDFF
tara:strand:- start:140 stop:775 length:636 start_codon:yes stop_codon:yes gene_type:complete